MLNIISSDIFRVRKGTALYGVIGGIFALFLLMAVIFKIINFPVIFDMTETDVTVVPESNVSIEADLDDDIVEFLPDNGAEFLLSMFTETSNGLALFLLPLIISVFGADFSAGTFRNLLSYESGRKKIYIAKLICTLVFSIIMLLAFVVVGGLLGSLFFGFGGFSVAFISQIFTILALQLPIYIALICIGHCILAFSKKCSYTIATYIVGLLVWSFVLQMVGLAIPRLSWVIQLDLMSMLNTLANYKMVSNGEIVFPVIFAVGVMIISFGLGGYRYKTTDFDFN